MAVNRQRGRQRRGAVGQASGWRTESDPDVGEIAAEHNDPRILRSANKDETTPKYNALGDCDGADETR
eukprot:1630942-Pleurochrysis_carterae.AAC.1